MSEIFQGQIVLNGASWVPEGWHLCDGTLLPVIQYSQLFSVLGNRFGGDGRTNFALPKLANVGEAAYIIALEGAYPARPN